MSFAGVLMRGFGMLRRFFMITLLMMLCRCVVGLGSILVVLRSLLVFVGWHGRDTSGWLEGAVDEKVSSCSIADEEFLS
jgi:hypothetical protein